MKGYGRDKNGLTHHCPCITAVAYLQLVQVVQGTFLVWTLVSRVREKKNTSKNEVSSEVKATASA